LEIYHFAKWAQEEIKKSEYFSTNIPDLVDF